MKIPSALVLVTFLACSRPFDEASPTVSAPENDAGADVSTNAVDAGGLPFTACPGGYSGGCAKIPVPLDWSNPDGKKIDVLVDKISSTPHPKAQLWLLQGGPGGTAADMIPLAQDFADQLDDFEILTIEHRGVGASNRLGCPDEEKNTTAFSSAVCREEAKALYGDDLRHYTTTHAAKDLARAIELTRREGTKVFVFGVSYGTYWAQRLLQVAPTASDGVILDSMVVPGEQFLSKFDPQVDVVAQKLAELCKTDADCTAALGADPWAKIVATKEAFVGGHCSALGFAANDRAIFTGLMRNHDFMPYAFAAWARIDRCSADDVKVLKALVTRLKFFGSPNAGLNSDILGINIMLSEMFEEPFPSHSTMLQRFDDAVFPAGVGLEYVSLELWPRYPHDEYVGKLPDLRVPVLVLAGTFDTQTPIELQELAKAHYSTAGSTFVTVPYANHGVIGQSPMPGILGGRPPQCGMKLSTQFLKAPGSALDTSCTAQVIAPSFARPSDEIGFLLSTDSLWLSAKVVPEVAPIPDAFARFRTIPRMPLQQH